ncbi:MAG: hypothetical protein AAGI38_16060, partial [Bacteroidota bacterium]
MKTITKWFFLLILAAFTGCNIIYYPNEVQVPNVQPGEVEGTVSMGSNADYSVSLAVSPVNHLLLTANTSSLDREYGERGRLRSQNLHEIGVGTYFEPVPKFLRLSFIGGYAWGDTRSQGLYGPGFLNYDSLRQINTNFRKPYGQMILQGFTHPFLTNILPQGVQFNGGGALRVDRFEFAAFDLIADGANQTQTLPRSQWKYNAVGFMAFTIPITPQLTSGRQVTDPPLATPGEQARRAGILGFVLCLTLP